MKKLTEKQIKAGAAGILFAAAVICYSVGIGRGTDVREPEEEGILTEYADGLREETSSEMESKEAGIYIHVCGSVNNPGVYEFAEGSRAWDAVEAAGGLKEDAAADAVNLAQRLVDGQQLWIPDKEEAETAVGKVNLNTASKEELMTLAGIGEARAEAIIAYRRDAGPFLVIEDIMKVSGIKETAFQKIKDDITV